MEEDEYPTKEIPKTKEEWARLIIGDEFQGFFVDPKSDKKVLVTWESERICIVDITEPASGQPGNGDILGSFYFIYYDIGDTLGSFLKEMSDEEIKDIRNW